MGTKSRQLSIHRSFMKIKGDFLGESQQLIRIPRQLTDPTQNHIMPSPLSSLYFFFSHRSEITKCRLILIIIYKFFGDTGFSLVAFLPNRSSAVFFYFPSRRRRMVMAEVKVSQWGNKTLGLKLKRSPGDLLIRFHLG